jgi:serine/threonine protein kinase
LIIPIGQALVSAHNQGIVHRDVKPANILLPQPDWPLLADFGLVKIMGGAQNITRPGAILGTPAYFAPEQILGGGTDVRSDIYSLGIVLYELLTGSPPLMAGSPIEMMQRRLQESPPLLSRIVPGISPQLEMIVLRSLDRKPETRYQTMREFVNALSMLPGATGRVRPDMPPTVATANPATEMLGGGTAVVGPRLIVLGTGAVLPLSAHHPTTLVRGSSQSSPIPTLDLEPHGGSQAGVSRHHARIYRSGSQWFIEDMNSTNGTFVNETMLTPGQPIPLANGSQVRCSRLILVFHEN